MSMADGRPENKSIDAESDTRSNLSETFSIPSSLIESLRDSSPPISVKTDTGTSLKSYVGVTWTTESDEAECSILSGDHDPVSEPLSFSTVDSCSTVSNACITNFEYDEFTYSTDVSSAETFDTSEVLTDFSCDDFYCPEYSTSSACSSDSCITAVDLSEMRV